MKPTPNTVEQTAAMKIANATQLAPPDPDVLGMLGLEPGKKPRATRRTLLAILAHDPRWKGRIKLDLFRDSIVVDGEGLTDRDLTHLACWMEEIYEVNPSKDLVVECLSAVAADNAFHPVRD